MNQFETTRLGAVSKGVKEGRPLAGFGAEPHFFS